MTAPPPHLLALLVEAASEVSRACPWVPIDDDGDDVAALTALGLLGATDELFGITPAGVRAVRARDHALAMEAIAGLRRNRDAGQVMPWHV